MSAHRANGCKNNANSNNDDDAASATNSKCEWKGSDDGVVALRS